MLDLSCGAKIDFSGTVRNGNYIEGTGIVKTQNDDTCNTFIRTLKINGEDVTETYSTELSFQIPIELINSSTPA